MSGEQMGGYVRLWGGERSPQCLSRPVSGARGRKTRGVTNRRNDNRTAPTKAIARGNSAGGCGSQSVPLPHRRPASSAGVSRRNMPPSRATTPPPLWSQSEGFSDRGFSLQHPQGFNIREYVRTHGSSKGIRIGRNGCISSDKYFGRYLEECASTTALCEEASSDSTAEEEEGEGEEQNSWKGNEIEATQLHFQPATLNLVPLCWEDQLKKTKPEKILTMKKNVQKKKHNSSQYSAIKLSSVRHLQELLGWVSVSVTWKQSSLLQKTLLRQLNLHTSSSLRCVVPRVDLEEEEREGDNRLEVTDLEATPLDDVPVKGEDIADDLGEHLCIYFHCTNSSILTAFRALSFEVSLYPSNCQVSPPSSTPISTIAKPRVISDVECALYIQFDMPKDPHRLAVVCCVPRTPMFNIAVDVSAMASPDGNKVCECKKRYVQDPVAKHTQSKEEDEDITDLSALAEQFPDLNNMMELLNDYTAAPPTPPPFPSPVHGAHLYSLNVMATKYRGEALFPGKHQYAFGMTQHAHPAKEEGVAILVEDMDATRWRSNVKEQPRSLYRPAPQVDTQPMRRYSSIVSQQELAT